MILAGVENNDFGSKSGEISDFAPEKRILAVNMQKPNPHPVENDPLIWILD